ncbi:hypothetical protein MHYP_G00256700 [Metynnis hypsauchen]
MTKSWTEIGLKKEWSEKPGLELRFIAMKMLHYSKMMLTCVLFFIIYCSVGVYGDIEMDYHGPVTGILTKNVKIPCSFRVIPDQPINSAKVIWWKDQAYSGSLLYQCVRNSDLSGNCTKSTGRFSFGGNLPERNIALWISNVTQSDAGLYFCRIELEEKVNWFTSQGITLNVKAMLGALGAVLGIVLFVNLYVLASFCRRVAATNSSEDADNVYHNFPRRADLDGIYMNARKTTPTSK